MLVMVMPPEATIDNAASQQKRSSSFGWWAAGAITLSVTILWTLWLGVSLWFQGDLMVGFHPAALSYLLLPILLGIMTVAGLVTRRWLFAILCLAAFALSIGMLKFGSKLEGWAWERSIRDHAPSNVAALAKVPSLVQLDENLTEALGQDAQLTVIPGVQWYCEQDFAAPQGVFRGFTLQGVPHIRIQKIRHGYRGLAYMPPPANFARLRSANFLRYRDTATHGWAIWTTDE